MQSVPDFKEILKSSYLPQSKAKEKLEGLGYQYDTELSNPENKVFFDPATGLASVAVRGSKTFRDWAVSDPLVALGFGKYDPRQKETNALVKKVSQKYGQDPNLYGHSLSGALIENAPSKGQKYTYNKAVGLWDIGKNIPKNQKDFRTSGDLISALSVTQKKKTKGKTIMKFQNPFKAHALSNL